MKGIEKLYFCNGKRSCGNSIGCHKNGGACCSTTEIEYAIKDAPTIQMKSEVKNNDNM